MAEAPSKQDEVEAIRTALRGVHDPEIGISVMELGMIREITAGEQQIDIKMILTSPFCPLAGMIVAQVQRAAEQAAGRTVKVTLADEPWDPSMIGQQ